MLRNFFLAATVLSVSLSAGASAVPDSNATQVTVEVSNNNAEDRSFLGWLSDGVRNVFGSNNDGGPPGTVTISTYHQADCTGLVTYDHVEQGNCIDMSGIVAGEWSVTGDVYCYNGIAHVMLNLGACGGPQVTLFEGDKQCVDTDLASSILDQLPLPIHPRFSLDATCN